MNCGERVDITGCRNTSIDLQFLLTASGGSSYNLSGHNVYAQARKHGALVLDFQPFVTGDTASGDVRIQVTDETTSGLMANTYDWDMILETPLGDKDKIMHGKFYLYETQTLQ